MKPEIDTKAFECVLPDGRFASILAARVTTIDGRSYSTEEWCEFDYLDHAPIIVELQRRLVSAGASRGVA